MGRLERGGRYLAPGRPPRFQCSTRTACLTVSAHPHSVSDDHTTNVTLEDVSLDGQLLVDGVCTSGRGRDRPATVLSAPATIPAGLAAQSPVSRRRTDAQAAASTTRGTLTSGIRIRCHAMATPIAQDCEIFGEGFVPKRLGFGASIPSENCTEPSC